jgi:hypothetical protein
LGESYLPVFIADVKKLLAQAKEVPRSSCFNSRCEHEGHRGLAEIAEHEATLTLADGKTSL